MKRLFLTVVAALATNFSSFAFGEIIVDLGGPATGFAALSNLKNSTTQFGIEGKDSLGNPNPNHNGLPEYANYRMANGNWTAIIASPQSTVNDYSGFASFTSGTFGGGPIVVNNQTITQSDFSTLSSGQISFSPSLLTGVGTEIIAPGSLTFNFNTYLWDGNVTPAQTGDPRSNFNATYASPETPIAISPLSPVYTPYNDGSGAGNAQVYYRKSITNVTGDGLTFVNGQLSSMDLNGNLTVNAFIAPFNTFGSLNYFGTFSASGLNYQFDVSGTASAFIFNNVNFLMNRSGTASFNASAVPEPSTWAILGVVGTCLAWRKRRRTVDHENASPEDDSSPVS